MLEGSEVGVVLQFSSEACVPAPSADWDQDRRGEICAVLCLNAGREPVGLLKEKLFLGCAFETTWADRSNWDVVKPEQYVCVRQQLQA